MHIENRHGFLSFFFLVIEYARLSEFVGWRDGTNTWCLYALV